jgi:hypothetical protein
VKLLDEKEKERSKSCHCFNNISNDLIFSSDFFDSTSSSFDTHIIIHTGDFRFSPTVFRDIKNVIGNRNIDCYIFLLFYFFL